MQRGDSGAWVVDRLSGVVFGHVIASNDCSAYIVPLKDTLSAVSQSAKLKGTGEIISIPPAFDLLANLARAYYIVSVGEKFKGADAKRALHFASQALSPRALKHSQSSPTAEALFSCFNWYPSFGDTFVKVSKKLNFGPVEIGLSEHKAQPITRSLERGTITEPHSLHRRPSARIAEGSELLDMLAPFGPE